MRVVVGTAIATMMVLGAFCCEAAAESVESVIRKELLFFVGEAEVDALLSHIKKTATATRKRLEKVAGKRGKKIPNVLFENIRANLEGKRELSQGPMPLSLNASEIRRTIVEYEAFKLVAYTTSGVFPKRYFGYFDEKYDTARHEKRLKQTVRKAVAVVNGHLRARGSALRITEAEVAITFIAEGGALWLREHQDKIDRLHPVLDVGLDDLAGGFSDLPGLMERLDEEVGTSLGSLVGWVEEGAKRLPGPSSVPNDRRWLKGAREGKHPYLIRLMNFEEAIVGTALMWLWEKEIARRKIERIGESPLERRPLDEQFVIASLVYNSGRLHDPERWRMILDFSTAAWIRRTSERNAKRRWRLNVWPPREALLKMIAGEGYPEQPTAWLAVYHVLQRHGAYVAMKRFTDVFDENGMFRLPT